MGAGQIDNVIVELDQIISNTLPPSDPLSIICNPVTSHHCSDSSGARAHVCDWWRVGAYPLHPSVRLTKLATGIWPCIGITDAVASCCEMWTIECKPIIQNNNKIAAYSRWRFCRRRLNYCRWRSGINSAAFPCIWFASSPIRYCTAWRRCSTIAWYTATSSRKTSYWNRCSSYGL